MSSPKHMLFTANDPGGANAIVPVVEKLLSNGEMCTGFLTGPAKAIFERAHISFVDGEQLKEGELQSLVNDFKPDCILAGTSAGNSIDKNIRSIFPGIPSVYVLDFWSNYAIRFSREGDDLAHLPTIVCVMDELAKKEMMGDGIPEDRIRITGNPYMERFTIGISTDRENESEILFISQPIREVEGGRHGFDQYTVLASVSAAVRKLPERFHLLIRLHPKDDRNLFHEYLGDRVSLAQGASLEDDLARAGLVIGMYSPVLIQAAAAGKRVVSYEPGLLGVDPLPTNRLGLTQSAQKEDELTTMLSTYAAGQYPRTQIDIHKIWPPGATERILAILDQVTRR